MPRSASRLIALLLTASALTTALAGCSMMGDITGAPKEIAVKDKPLPQKAAASDIDGNLRQAQLLRQAGSYDEAIHILSQLMLMSADDPRIVAEYGKALAQKGRASDAAQFLRRAVELSPNDWTLYSALGVSYDQLGDAANARLAYEHALALRPGEASALNNYALSRMLAKDPDGARALIARAQIAAGGAADPKIARNVELITGMAPDNQAEAARPVATASAAPAKPAPAPAKVTPEPKVAAAAPKPSPGPAAPASSAPFDAAPQSAPQNAPKTSGDVARLLASQTPAGMTDATAAPRPLVPAPSAPPIAVVEMQPPAVEAAAQAPQAASGVVMQAVPYDPYAGPVAKAKKPQPKVVAKAVAPAEASSKKAVATAQAASNKAETPKTRASKTRASETDDAKADTKPADGKTQKTAEKPAVVPALRIAADKY